VDGVAEMARRDRWARLRRSSLPRFAALRPAVLVAATAAFVLPLAGCGSRSGAATGPSFGTVIDQPLPVPDTPLVDQNGHQFTLTSLHGKYVVLAQFLTLCQEECPLTTAAFDVMKKSVDRAGLSGQVDFAEVTLDPARDTPARLAAYQRQFGTDWALLTGAPADVAALWKRFGIYYQKVPESSPPGTDWLTGRPLAYDMSHSNGFILIDRSGDERFVTQDLPDLHGQISPALRRLLSQDGLRNLQNGDPSGQNYTIPQALAALSWLVGRPIPLATS